MTLSKKSGEKDIKQKVVIRKLPPTMNEEEFLKVVSPLPENNFLYYVCGEVFGEPFSRAYFNFMEFEEILNFKDKFDNYVFVDDRGNDFLALVEYAPFQKISKIKNKIDPKIGTILKDPDYLKFLEKLQNPEPEVVVPLETILEKIETNEKKNNLKNSKMTTPLIEYLRKREDRRESKRREIDKEKKEEEKKKKFPTKQRSKIKKEKDSNPQKLLISSSSTKPTSSISYSSSSSSSSSSKPSSFSTSSSSSKYSSYSKSFPASSSSSSSSGPLPPVTDENFPAVQQNKKFNETNSEEKKKKERTHLIFENSAFKNNKNQKIKININDNFLIKKNEEKFDENKKNEENEKNKKHEEKEKIKKNEMGGGDTKDEKKEKNNQKLRYKERPERAIYIPGQKKATN